VVAPKFPFSFKELQRWDAGVDIDAAWEASNPVIPPVLERRPSDLRIHPPSPSTESESTPYP
jgi:hypothetical protein